MAGGSSSDLTTLLAALLASASKPGCDSQALARQLMAAVGNSTAANSQQSTPAPPATADDAADPKTGTAVEPKPVATPVRNALPTEAANAAGSAPATALPPAANAAATMPPPPAAPPACALATMPPPPGASPAKLAASLHPTRVNSASCPSEYKAFQRFLDSNPNATELKKAYSSGSASRLAAFQKFVAAECA